MRTLKVAAGALLWMAVLGVAAGCARPGVMSGNGEGSFKQSLRELHGVFSWNEDHQAYEYSELVKLDELLSAQDSTALVSTLIEWLDDPSPTQSSFEGRPMPLGLVSYRALTLLVYYEPTDSTGDLAESWDGFLTPTATPGDYRKAKQAWKEAEEAKLLITL